MPNRAVVIGIDRYATDLSSLSGAVADAQAFASWLLASGEMLPQDLQLGLLPGDDAPPEPVALATCARVGTTREALDRLFIGWLKSPLADTGRFYFFFSGHGAASANPAYNEEAICLEGFSDDAMGNTLEISSLTAMLNALPAVQRFILIDGCRNTVFNDDVQFGAFSRRPRPDKGERRNYVLRATGPGRAAAEVAGRGLFSRHLCEGLQGAGSAKRWDPNQAHGDGAYVVRWRALSEYVFDQVTPHRAAQRNEQLIFEEGQHPANEDPELAVFAEGFFGLSKMVVRLASPATPPAQTTVFLRRNDSADPDLSQLLPASGEVEIMVPPSAWMLWASASGWRSSPKSKAVPVYAAHVDEVIELVPNAATSRGNGNGAPAIVMLGAKPRPAQPTGPGQLRIEVAGRPLTQLRPAARVAVRRESGEVVADPVREDVLMLAAGIYRVRLDLAGGAWVEDSVLVAAEEQQTIDLRLPDGSSEALDRTLLAAGKPHSTDGFALPSEMMGWLAAPSVATVAGLAVAQAVQAYGYGLDGLGVGQAWADAQAIGIELLSTDERQGRAAAPAPRVFLWRMQARSSTLTAATLAATHAAVPIASASEPVQAGGYWLQFTEPGGSAFDRQRAGERLATQVLPGHVTLVLRQWLPSGESMWLQFAVRRDPVQRFEIQLGLVQGEALQRALAAGRDPLADPAVLGLADGQWFEPFSALAAAAALLARGEVGRVLFGRLVALLAVRGIGGPDAAVLRAAQATLEGRDDLAAAMLKDVLGMGTAPIIDSLLERLVAEIRRLDCADGPLQRRNARWLAATLVEALGQSVWTWCRGPVRP